MRSTPSSPSARGECLSLLDLSGTTHTNAGTYTDVVTFTDTTGNYKNATKLLNNFIR